MLDTLLWFPRTLPNNVSRSSNGSEMSGRGFWEMTFRISNVEQDNDIESKISTYLGLFEDKVEC